MQMTEQGLALIRRFEGFRGEAYRCPAGVWTIGYGHTAAAGPPVVKPGMTMSEADARRVLAADVVRFASAVRLCLTREVNGEQFSALVSFAFNVGVGAFRGSSVLRAVNEGRFADVPERLMLWVKAGGTVLPGLQKRRAAEAALFMSRPRPDVSAPVAAAGVGAAAAAIGVAGSAHDGTVLAVLLALVVLIGGFIWWRIRKNREVR